MSEAPTKHSLEEVLAIFRSGITSQESHEFRLDSLDRLGVPLWGVFAWAENGDFADGFGYGPDPLAAKVGAWGEVLENRWATASLKNLPTCRASYASLGSAAIDPRLFCLDAGAPWDPEATRTWTTATRWPSFEKVWVPLEAAAISAHEGPDAAERLWMPITNGLGAGVSLEQALAHGILEQVQRDGDSVAFRALDRGDRIRLDDVRDEGTRARLRELDDAGIEVFAKLAEVTLGMPVVYVVGYDRDIERAPFSLALSACGEAAHPDREQALRKALDEFVSSRSRKRFMHGTLDDMRAVAPPAYSARVESDPSSGDESRALRSVLDWTNLSRKAFFDVIADPLFKVRSTRSLESLPTAGPEITGSAAALLAHLDERLRAEESEVLFIDFTPPGAPFSVVKTCCPRLEVETMSYHRIGRRNFERLARRAADDPTCAGLVGVGTPPPGALNVHLTPADEAAIGGPAWLDPDAIARKVGPLYALYREPNGHTVGKLKAQIR